MSRYLTLFLPIVFIVAVEAVLYFLSPATESFEGQLLHMAYQKAVRMERLVAVAKFDVFRNEQAELVQIGDSTGLVGINPAILAPYLPSGWRYVNASLQVPAQFEGMETMAEQILRQDNRRKYLVGLFSVFHIGSLDDGFGEDIAAYYGSVWRYAQWMPSLRFRSTITSHVYYPSSVPKEIDFGPTLESLRNLFKSTAGWMGLDLHQPFEKHKCAVIRFRPRVAMEREERLAALAKKYNVTLILALSPIKCEEDETTRLVQKELLEFHVRHPEVLMPLPFPFVVPPSYLGDEVHVNSQEGTELYSKTLGKALQSIVQAADTK